MTEAMQLEWFLLAKDTVEPLVEMVVWWGSAYFAVSIYLKIKDEP